VPSLARPTRDGILEEGEVVVAELVEVGRVDVLRNEEVPETKVGSVSHVANSTTVRYNASTVKSYNKTISELVIFQIKIISSS
jgi:hypothetical protein